MEKTCLKCKKSKNINNFQTDKRGTRNVCVSCRNENRKIVIKIKKSAPPKPNECECCGKESKLVLDHCHQTEKFRGWLCNQCNIAIGNLGDNISGVTNAVLYLAEFHETK
jgi:uncharacterized ferredoxin-like protein